MISLKNCNLKSRIISVLMFFIAVSALVCPANVFADQKQTWRGQLVDGTVIDEDRLSKIVDAHRKWLGLNKDEGVKPDLSKAILSKANLNWAILSYADLSEANLSGANLTHAFLIHANLDGAKMRHADLSWAFLSGADLRNADLRNANLRWTNLRNADLSVSNLNDSHLSHASLDGANMSGTSLRDADLNQADLSETNLINANLLGAEFLIGSAVAANLSGSVFAPRSVSAISLAGVKGLSKILIHSSTVDLLVGLRKDFKDLGFRNEEKAIISALRKYQLNFDSRVAHFFNGVVLGGSITDYGAESWNSLFLLLFLIFPFSIFYMIALRSHRKKTGIWVIRPAERIIKGSGIEKPFKISTRLLFRPKPTDRFVRIKWKFAKRFRVLRIGLYFSLLSATSIGWRELNVGNWISRIQKREYTLRATGWVRSVSGIQSLLSVYLLALWALTYFGRPFE